MFADTSALYSFFFSGEKNHLRAKEIIQKQLSQNKAVYYSDYVLDEFLTLSRKRKGGKTSNQLLEYLLGSQLKLIYTTKENILAGLEIFQKYENLSFTDSASIAIMLEKGLKEICSFDKDFDSVPKIVRIH